MIIASGPGCADFCDGRCNEPNNRNQYSTGAQHHNDYVYDDTAKTWSMIMIMITTQSIYLFP